MKRLLLLTGVLVVAGVLTVTYRTRTMKILSGDITNQITQIEDAYGKFIEQYAFGLELEVQQQAQEEGQPEEEQPEGEHPEEEGIQLTQSQEELLKELHSLHDKIAKKDRDELARINTINRIQTTLHKLVQSFSKSTAQKSRSIVALEQEIGERGEVRELLKAYNGIAKLWNNNVKSSLGSLTATVSDVGQNLYPYLRFDGESETTTRIDLGG